MPYKIEKCNVCGCGTYKVINKLTGKVHAKHTTLKKAQAQVRLVLYTGQLVSGGTPRS